MMKFQLSSALIHKLCLVQYGFRKNGIPDDIFWYMINPLFKTDMNDVCVWHWGEFMKILEYDYNFNITIKDDGYILGPTLPYTLACYKQDKFNSSQFFVIHRDNKIIYFISYIKDCCIPYLYVVFKIENNFITSSVCYNKYDTDYDDLNDSEIEEIIYDNEFGFYHHYSHNSDSQLRKLGIKREHLKLLIS
jgi:hypothetical protein